jgi:acyl-CoA reductase-like NAD-dependent aldehyde dehydrogenase
MADVGYASGGNGTHTALEAGEVLINGAPNLAVHRPFGGIGISGVGKEGGHAGLRNSCASRVSLSQSAKSTQHLWVTGLSEGTPR